jgi:hypothetical protein
VQASYDSSDALINSLPLYTPAIRSHLILKILKDVVIDHK